MRSSRKPSPQRPVVEALEPKLLYSADMGLSAFVPPPTQAVAAVHASATPAATVSDAAQAVQQAKHEIVFIDATVPDADALVRDIQQQATNGRAIEVIVIRQDEDGIARITQTLQNQHDVSAIHLIGHGESGDMQLGTSQLDAQTLLTRATDIAQWGTAMTAQADVLLYGCDVAAGTPGHALVQNLAALTGADVAASDDLTGSASLGGNWTLEVQTGQIDEALAFSATMQAQYTGLLAMATPTTKGAGIWTENGFTTPQGAGWDGLTLSGQGGSGVTTTWTHIVSAESPTRNEAIAVGVDSSGVIRGEMWNGSQWTTLPMNPLTSSATAGEQGFAVAYEQQSGNAMLVWNNGTTVSYSVFNGTSWTAAKNIDVYNGSAAETMHIAAQPHGNGMTLVVTDSKQDDYAMVWDGTSWGHAITLDTSGFTSIDQHNSAVAYESQSGTVMVAYAKFANTNVYYRTFDGANWSAETTAGSYTESALPLWLTLASDPNSDRIGMGLLTVVSSSTNNGTTTIVTQPSFSIWNGSSWGSRTVQSSYSDTSLSGSTVAVAFESVSGDALAVYGTTASTVRYLTWNSSSGWSSVTTGPNTTQPGSLALFSDPYTDNIMLGVQGKGGALSYTDWTGSAFGTVNTVATTTGSTVTPAFTWLWGTDLSGNKTNTLLLSSSTAATGWTGVNSLTATDIVEFADPNLHYGTTTSGTFSHLVDLGALGASGVDDIVMVSRDVTLTAGLVVHRGDILFTTNGNSTLTNADGSTTSASKSDLVMYRPTVAGNYSKGTFTVLAQNIAGGTLGLGTADVRGLALLEQDTVLGDITLTQGTILFTAGTTTAAADIQRYVPSGGGLLGGLLTGNISTILKGSDANIGIGQAITGLEIVSQTTPLQNVTLAAGTLLISMEAADSSVGVNHLNVAAADVIALVPTVTSVNGAGSATASLLMRGSSVGATGKVFDSLALSLDAAPVITSNGGGATASVSRAENGTAVTTVTATDIDADTLTYSITGGADAALFQIDASTGALRFVAAPDYETPLDANHDNQYLVTVSASDGTYADTQAITVTVTNVNEAPVITSDGGGVNAVISVVEGTTAVTQITSTDPDVADTPSYSISGTDAGLFNVDVSTGVVTFKTAPSYASPQDANADNIYNLTLTATDMHGLSDTQAAYIRVTPSVAGANATPVIDSDGGGNTAAVSINEGDTAVTNVHATDADSSNLTYSITGGTDQSFFDIDPLSGALSFHTAPNAAVKADANQDNVYEVTVSASDGNSSDTQDLSVTVQAYNKPPVNTLPATYDISQNTTLPMNGVVISDSDAGSGTITVNLDVQHGILFVLNNVSNGLNSSQITYSNANSHVVLTGTLDQINTTLSADGGLLYRPSTNFVGNDTLTLVSDDGGNSGVAHTPAQTSDTDTSTIHVVAADIAPTLTTSSGTAGYTENAAAVVVDPGLNLSDPDTSTFTTATAQITGHYISTEDVLSFTPQAGITGSWNANTGTLTLTGSASPSDYQAALRSVSYLNSSDNPDPSNRTISFSISDTSSTAVASRDVVVTAVNDPPTLTTTSGSAMQYTENAAATSVDPGITLTDVDNPTYTGATVQITGHFNNVQDVLSFVDQSGITGQWDSSTGLLTLSGSASIANYQAALRSVGYYNTSDAPDTTARTVTFSVNDGSGAVTATRDIAITAVNDPPSMFITNTTLGYTENDAPKAVAPALAAYDPDNSTFPGATIQITSHYVSTQDVLSFTNQSGITGSWNASTGTLTLTGTASTSAYQSALESVAYANTSDNPDTTTRTVTFSVSDGTDTTTATRDIAITAVNDAPVLATTNTSLSYTENAAATAIDSGLTLSDPDNSSFAGATVRISSGYASGEDVLGFSNQAGITGTWDASTGTLTLTGSASTAAYQTALRSITYRNTSDSPDTTTRTITFGLSDGLASASATRNIAITAVNDAPALTTTGSALSYTEKDAPTAIDAALTLSDADNNSFAGASVQITGHFSSSEDVLSFTNQSGISGTWNASTGTLTLSGSASTAAYQAALRSVSYSNTSSNPDTTARTITFSISDGTDTGTATRAISITAVNDAPVVLANSLSISQGGTATPVISLSDPDSNLATLSISATGVTGGHFLDNRNQTTVSQFTYGDVQTGRIQFVDDGTGVPPGYTLTVSDGQASSGPSVVSVNYTATPITAAPPPPPPPTTEAPAPAPAPAPTPAPSPTESHTTTTAVSQSAAPNTIVVYAPEPQRTASIEPELRLPTPAPKPAVDVQTRIPSGSSDTVTPVQAVNEAFQFSWSANLQTPSASEDLRRNLDALREQLQDQGVERRHVVASSIALTTGLSVGYVIWLVRGGALIGSMLSAMPAWQMIDPLPVLTRGRARGAGEAVGGEDQSVEQLFDGDNDAAPESPPTPHAHATVDAAQGVAGTEAHT